MLGQLSQTLSTHHAPLETGSRKRSGLVVTLKSSIFARPEGPSTATDIPQTGTSVTAPEDAVVVAGNIP